MTAAALRRKLDRIGKRVPVAGVPSVVRVQTGETIEQAVQRFAARYPLAQRPRTSLLVVPAIVTEAEQRAFMERFKASQLALLSEVRRSRPNASEPATSPITNPIPVGAKPVLPRFKLKRSWRPNICPV